LLCQYTRKEGGFWEDCELPDNIGDIVAGLIDTVCDRWTLDLRVYGYGYVAVLKLDNGMIFDPQLKKHGIDPWSTRDLTWHHWTE
jgi:hypothetical protein